MSRPLHNDLTARPRPATSAAFLFTWQSANRLAALLAIVIFTARATADETATPFDDNDRSYWAFQPVRRPAISALAPQPANPLDAFVLSRLNRAKIPPLGEADKRTLIRRATFDVQGLPPTADEVAAFLADNLPDAYARLVDRLLASPRFGEHWARHWLDLVRYAESDGYKADDIRPNAWRYRDYVIRALNEDKPYDRFVTEQLAGDELPAGEREAIVATGFLRLGPYEENGRDVLDQRANILNDITDCAGQVFLGLTLGCARCHDHKYDPLLQRDYYRLQAFFAPLKLSEDEPLATREEQAEYDLREQRWQNQTRDLRRELAALEAPHRAKIRASKRSVFPDYVQAVLDAPPERRSPLERQMMVLTERQLVVDVKEVLASMNKEEQKEHEELQTQLGEFDATRPPPLERAMTACDNGPVAPPTFIPGSERVAAQRRAAGKGAVGIDAPNDGASNVDGATDADSTADAEAAAVPPGYLSILDARPASIEPLKDNPRSTGRRLALSRWITSPVNPLTARVFVNRIWQQYFGVGLVATASDFGQMGATPTHPELLDLLADELVHNGWQAKSIHRLILTSAAYRRASHVPAVSAELTGDVAAQQPHEVQQHNGQSLDPNNELLWRFSRQRLTAEQLRDAMLAASGELNEKQGGESIRPELPEGISAAYAWKPTADARERNRRSIYLFVRRNLREPLLESLDMPDPHESCARRMATTTAPQALVLLNGRWALDRSRALAARVLAEVGGGSQNDSVDGRAAWVRSAYSFTLERNPNDEELATASQFLTEQTKLIAARLTRGESVALPTGKSEPSDLARAAALVDFCHVLLNSNEFAFLD